MNGQLDFFDLIEVQQAQEIKMCTTCANCKTTDLYKPFAGRDGMIFMAFCNPTRQVITDHTASWLCRNKYYERRRK